MIDIIPVTAMPDDPRRYIDTRDARVSCAFLLPSLCADIAVRAFLHSGAPRQSYAAASLAASVFLTSVRGLPLDEISVQTPNGVFYALRPKKADEYGVLLPKCKVLCSKTMKFASSIEARCSEVVTARGVVRVFECADAKSYSHEALSLFSLGGEGENICATVAVSLTDGRLRMRAHTVSSVENADLYALVCGVSVLARRAPTAFPIFADLSGITFRAQPVGDMLHISTPVSFMTFPIPKN